MDYNLKEDNVTVKSSTVIKLSEYLTLTTKDETFDLRVDILADFENIPIKYHEVFLNMLTAKYLNKVSFSDNPFSVCQLNKKRKWWNFFRKFPKK